jgi:hypothetical protein
MLTVPPQNYFWVQTMIFEIKLVFLIKTFVEFTKLIAEPFVSNALIFENSQSKIETY